MSGEWMRGGDWYKCGVHNMVYPRGACCPACGEPPEPVTLEDIDERLRRIEKLLEDKTKRNKFRRGVAR